MGQKRATDVFMGPAVKAHAKQSRDTKKVRSAVDGCRLTTNSHQAARKCTFPYKSTTKPISIPPIHFVTPGYHAVWTEKPMLHSMHATQQTAAIRSARPKRLQRKQMAA